MRRLLSLTALAALALCACEPVTAADRVYDATFQPTAEWRQFDADTWATATARSNEFMAAQADAEATAAQAAATRAALVAQVTAEAVAVATATARAEASMTQSAQAAATATAEHDRQATATSQVQSTLTAIDLRTREADARRAELTSTGWAVLLLLAGGGSLAALWLLVATVRRRLGVVRYGPNGNPLVLADSGRGLYIINPIADTVIHADGRGGWTGETISPAAREKLMAGYQALLLEQAQHSPHPPARPEAARSEKRAWKIGPVSETRETVTTPAGVPPPALTAEAPPSPAPKIAAPGSEKLHVVYVQGQGVSEADRDLMDLREMVERGALSGFARANWLGHKFASGHDGTRERYDWLIDTLSQAQVIAPAGRSWRLAVDVSQAIDALNLGHVELA